MKNKKRISAKEKGTLVLRVLRGSLIEEVSREAGVTVSELSQWREQFIQRGTDSFKRNLQESMEHRYERIVGRQHMEIELLKKKERFYKKEKRMFIEAMIKEKNEVHCNIYSDISFHD